MKASTKLVPARARQAGQHIYVYNVLPLARQENGIGKSILLVGVGNEQGQSFADPSCEALESKNGFLLCHDCHDFVYDPAFEDIRLAYVPSKKRKLSDAEEEPIDKRTVSSNSTAASCAATGLRGLYNMGQTCFMSVILQSLIHNPFIRSFYLNEGHKSSECERDACTSCALDDIFTDFYGQEKHEGYGAVHMLQGCWKGGGGLAGYSQQDAHEYLGFILNSLHTANTEEDDENEETQSTARDAKRCDCVIHQTFGGVYKSTVTCSACRNATNTFDAFTDLSLDIKAPAVSTKKKKVALTNGAAAKDNLSMELTECLTRFTSSETLSADNYTCRKCDKSAEAEKRLRLHRLPPVLPIHLKRFSHSKTSAQSTKVDTRVRFPFSLNIAPYTTMTVDLKAKAGSKESNKDDDKEEVEHKPEPIYTLTSVIVHKGKIDNGHYISFSRQAEEWFRFDDSMVVKVDEKEVLAAEAYMLFYTIESLDHL